MSEYTYPNSEYPPNSNLNNKQFHILNTLKEGDVVSFRAQGKKHFGQKHHVIKIVRNKLDVHVHSLPIKDTRVTTDRRYSHGDTAVGKPFVKGTPYITTFLPNSPRGDMSHEIRLH